MSSRTKCPDCNARKGLAEYNDGTYCFACHKSTKFRSLIDKKIQIIDHNLMLEKVKNFGAFPSKAEDFLHKFELKQNNDWIDEKVLKIYWSNSFQRILFTFNDEKSSWARSLNSLIKIKWLLIGDKKSFEIKTQNNKTVLLVEDIISAIKLSKFSNVICLGGSYINSLDLLNKIYEYENIILWLDGDEAGIEASNKIKKELGIIRNVHVIKTNKDPKEFNFEDIKNIIEVSHEKIKGKELSGDRL